MAFLENNDLPKCRVINLDENGRECEEYFDCFADAIVRFNQHKDDNTECNIEELILEENGDVNYESTKYSYTPDEED